MTNVRELRAQLETQFPSSFRLEVGAGKSAIILAIHASFEGQSGEERMARVEPLLHAAGLEPTITELYTPSEAEERGVALPPNETAGPVSWDEAVSLIDSGNAIAKSSASLGRPRRIVFYSYKGGVGRTTALVHTAFHLARAGRRVVVVDMDVEAPGLHEVLPRSEPAEGLVDYLWERQVRPFELSESGEPEICLVKTKGGTQRSIAYAVEDPVSHQEIHVIPAGFIGPDYVRRLASLSSHDVLTRSDDAWSLFEKELIEQLEPDVMLIDARTGLGEWGGMSLLRLADEAFLVLFPSNQNADGIRFVKNILEDLTDVVVHVVFSAIPEGKAGKELVSHICSALKLDEEECVKVFYDPNIASAERYPVETAMANYARIANLVLDQDVQHEVESFVQSMDRWRVIESLRFPERDAKAIAATDFEHFFQKTSDFDKFLDDARWVVRGRKGTGKSTLFHLFVEHQDNAIKRARGKLEGIVVLPGHGPAPGATLRPTTDVFDSLQRGVKAGNYDWLTLWRGYALIRIYSSKESVLIQNALKKKSMAPLRDLLATTFSVDQPNDTWRSSHTAALLAMLEEPLNGLSRDLLTDINQLLSQENRKIWLLYDDLDQDISEESGWQGEALGGLLRLAYDSNNRDLHNLRFKVFLREDIWSKLVFTNKSHFGEPRTLLLQWRIEDFLRLAYRLASGGSALFRASVQREFPMTDAEVDAASEEQLRQILAPLWGLNQERGKKAFAARWVYNRMTDARDNTYPRSLTYLLSEARIEELRGRNDKNAPSDRLLSPRAMQAGLKSASIERVNALKNEYPRLRSFLEDIERNGTLRSQFTKEELCSAWLKSAQSDHPDFNAFIAQLESAGLLVIKAGNTYDYGIASLYIDGLAVIRVQGEKK